MSKATPETREKVDSERPRESILWEWVKTIAYAVLLALFIRTFFLQTFKIPTGSMEPTLRGAMNYGHGDKIIVIKFIYGIRIPFTRHRVLALTEPKRGDVVVFETEGIEQLDQRKDFIKRIVGVGGERLKIVPDDPNWDPERSDLIRGAGHVYINGNPLKVPASIADRIYYPAGEYGKEEIKVPAGHYFMLGDHALNSRDSRFWGFVPRENVIGKAVAIYWPVSRIGLVR
ncbi:MAG: signal peptidase I [Candidatus Hydrogenedentota bacterium]|nr:MAG: signal peptidase I [Candidatus Hydrogenedentota bacterium]